MSKSAAYPQRIIALGLFFILTLTFGEPRLIAQAAAPSSAALSASDITSYRIFFRRVAIYKQMSDQAAAAGQDKGFLGRSVKNRLKLDDSDMMNLEIVALAHQQEIATLHAHAKDLIVQYRSQFPNLTVPAGIKLSPPAGLDEIKRQEDATTAKYWQKLNQALSPAAFQFADSEIRRTSSAPLFPARPGSQRKDGN
jgi:hypothetical protein